MQRRTSSLLLGWAVVCILGVGLTACSPSTVPSDDAGGASPSPENDSVETGPEASAAEATASDVDPAACLVGSWVVSNEFFLTAIQEFSDEIQSTEGEVLATFEADGTMTTEYRGWLITAVVEGHAVTIQRDGIDTGTFSATADTVDLQETQTGSAIELSGPGPVMTVPAAPMHYTSAPYTCDQSSATINTSDGAAELLRR